MCGVPQRPHNPLSADQPAQKEHLGPHGIVIFHINDLPCARSSSPLQNLIQCGNDSSIITALCCGFCLDTGGINVKHPLSLHASAEEIFLMADAWIEQMIDRMLRKIRLPRPNMVSRCCLVAVAQIIAIWPAAREAI